LKAYDKRTEKKLFSFYLRLWLAFFVQSFQDRTSRTAAEITNRSGAMRKESRID